MDDFKQLSKEIIHENPWWHYCHDKYLLPNGKEGDYYYGETAGGGASMVIPVTDDGRLVLVVQHRYIQDKKSIEFPCGSMNKDERPQEAAQRELMEETGYKSSDLVMVGSFVANNSVMKGQIYVYTAKELEKSEIDVNDETESIEIIVRRVDEFDEMVKRGEIWDGKTLAAWAMARNFFYKA